MKFRKICTIFLALILAGPVLAQLALDEHPGGAPQLPTGKPPEAKKDKDGIFEADWRHLGSFDLKDKKPGEELKKMMGQKIRLQGFVIPMEVKNKIMTEFFLVPYFPSCMHVPPPPPNQMLHVSANEKLAGDPTWFAVEAIGTLELKKERNNEGGFEDAFFQLEASKLKVTDSY